MPSTDFVMDFVIPVYKSAPFVLETVASLLAQKGDSPRIQIRSVAFPDIREKLQIPSSIPIQNIEKGKGIGADWEEALKLAPGPIATIAHSDDIYAPSYARKIREGFSQWPEAGVAFTLNDYVQNTAKLKTLLFIKRCLNPRPWAKKPCLIAAPVMLRALRLGCFIPCPTVSYHLPVLQKHLGNQPLFDPSLKIAVDWDAWVSLAQRGVPFIFIPEPLVTLRVHSQATTQTSLQNGLRTAEETQLLQKLWGPRRGKLLAKAFILGQRLQSQGKKK